MKDRPMQRAGVLLGPALAAVIVFGLFGCGGGDSTDTSSAATSDYTIADGLVITAPADLGSEDPKQAVLTVLDAVAEQVGFSSEWKACVEEGIDAIPDSEFETLDGLDAEERIQAAQQYNAKLSTSCGKEVDLVVSPDATPDQIDALRTLTAFQLGSTYSGGKITEAQTSCIVDKYEALPDAKVVEFANADARVQVKLTVGLLRICSKA